MIDDDPLATGYVSKRARGVYLAEWTESRDGTSDTDAFSTEAKAKAWIENACGSMKWSRLPSGMLRGQTVEQNDYQG